ncbi:MAG: imidazolonepropionase [Planctomycetaceae bacterium]|nr:imidazolonepropionase [Planctomycetaceae bacterium]
MDRLIHHDARILTLASDGRGPRRGNAMRGLGVIERGYIVSERGRIAAIGAGDAPPLAGTRRDMRGRVVMPAFVDCHTHALHAGERYGETAKRLAGVPYLEILAAGGGIMSTVRATREAMRGASAGAGLRDELDARLDAMRRAGTLAVEVKSGYGLDRDTELAMLDTIHAAARRRTEGGTGFVTPTFLGAHAIDGDEDRFCAHIVDEVLPEAVRRFGAIPCDAYCEKGAWSPAWTRRLFERAKALGCPLRVHVDQFNELGFLDTALELGARSVDHLEATSRDALVRVAKSPTTAVLLPGCGLTLDGRYANGRALVDAGASVAIATNCNPGSSPLVSMPLVIALAARFCGLNHEEAIVAATYNAACVLGLERETGSLEVGKRAHLVELPTRDERALAYEWGAAAPSAVFDGSTLWPVEGL